MVDSLFRLVIYGLIVVLVLGLFFQARAYLNEQQAVTQLNRLVAGVDNTYIHRDYPANADMIPTLIGFDAIPSGMRNGTTETLSHALGGAVAITGKADGAGYSIAFAGLEDGACATLANRYSGTDKKRTGLQSVSINGKQLDSITTTAVEEECDQGSNNSVTWNFF